jgi:hypothetical protein
VAFFKNLDYNWQIMDFESYQQQQVERQVNEVFEDVSFKPVQERMGIAAFDLVQYIDEERRANTEVFNSWAVSGEEAPRHPRLFRLVTLAGFVNVGFGFALPVEPVIQPAPSQPEVVSEKEKRLKDARVQIQNAKIFISSVYNLSLKEVKKTEAIARNLKASGQQ